MWLVLLFSCGSSEAPLVELPPRPERVLAAGTFWEPSQKKLWMRCAAGQEMLSKACSGVPDHYWIEDARSWCQMQRLSGLSWRLPTLEELRSLVVCTNGNTPDPIKGCIDPHFGDCYNHLWLPVEGTGATYWSSDGALSLEDGSVVDPDLIRDQYRTRCISDGVLGEALPPAPPEPLPRWKVVTAQGALIWPEPSLNAEITGTLSASQIVLAGNQGPEVLYQGIPDHFIPVQGHPWQGWTLESSLQPLPIPAWVEAIDRSMLLPIQEGQRRLALAGQQFSMLQVEKDGNIRIFLEDHHYLSPATSFRLLSPGEDACSRRLEQLGPSGRLLQGRMPLDPAACDAYEIEPATELFQGSSDAWRVHGRGGFEGYLVDGMALSLDARKPRAVGAIYAIGGQGDPEGDRCRCLKILRFHPQQIEVLLEKSWQEGVTPWSVDSNGDVAQGPLQCALQEDHYVCE